MAYLWTRLAVMWLEAWGAKVTRMYVPVTARVPPEGRAGTNHRAIRFSSTSSTQVVGSIPKHLRLARVREVLRVKGPFQERSDHKH